MKIASYKEIQTEDVEHEGASGAKMRWVISQADGAPTFSMRVFDVEPGGNTPFHAHPWEHEVFILDGEGVLVSEGPDQPLRKGDVVFIAPNEKHQFRNPSDANLEFICLVPNPQ